MGWFASTSTYTREIWSEAAPTLNEDGSEKTPGRGEKAEVTYRPLTAGDQNDIQDVLRTETEDDRSQIAIGTMRRMCVERAVVDWTLPGPKPTTEAIRQLAPHVFEQIYSYVELGTEHPTSSPSDAQAALNGASEQPSSDAPSSSRKPTTSSTAKA